MMEWIAIIPGTAAILFGLMLLVAPSLVKSIARAGGDTPTTDDWILKNRKISGVGFGLVGLVAIVSGFM